MIEWLAEEFAKLSAILLSAFALTAVVPALSPEQTWSVIIAACDTLNLVYPCMHTP